MEQFIVCKTKKAHHGFNYQVFSLDMSEDCYSLYSRDYMTWSCARDLAKAKNQYHAEMIESSREVLARIYGVPSSERA